MSIMKTLIHLSLTVLALGVPFSVHARTPEEDFTARCTAPGVVKCNGFDNTSSDIVQKQNLFPDGLGVFRGGLDPDQKASGAGSLRFALPPPPHAGANIAGSWMGPQSAPAFGRTFSQRSTFYLQFRLRLSPEMLTNSWPASNSYKIINMFHNGVSYGPIELTTINRYRTGLVDFGDIITILGAIGGAGVLGLLVAFGALVLRLQHVAFGEPKGENHPVSAAYAPLIVHLALVATLICAALIDFDGHVVPKRLALPVIFLAVVVSLVWPAVHPIAAVEMKVADLPAGFGHRLHSPIVDLVAGVERRSSLRETMTASPMQP